MTQLSLIPVCKEHGIEKVWIKDKYRREGGFYRCRACNARDSRARNARNRANPEKTAQLNADSAVRYHAQPQEKRDARSKQIVAQRRERFGKDPFAKEVNRLADLAHRQRSYEGNPNKFREGNLKKCYGISSVDYERIFDEQGGCCKICGSSSSGSKVSRRLFVDHCHATNQVRGLLCHGCNTAIGLMKEDTLRLQKAINYLNGGSRSFTAAVLDDAVEATALGRVPYAGSSANS